MIVAGLKRLALIISGLGIATIVVSLAVGLISGASLARSAGVGLMVLGSFMFVGGAAVGLRVPARPSRRPDGSFETVTLESPDDRGEAISVSYVLVGVGLFFVLLGVVVDPTARLV